MEFCFSKKHNHPFLMKMRYLPNSLINLKYQKLQNSMSTYSLLYSCQAIQELTENQLGKNKITPVIKRIKSDEVQKKQILQQQKKKKLELMEKKVLTKVQESRGSNFQEEPLSLRQDAYEIEPEEEDIDQKIVLSDQNQKFEDYINHKDWAISVEEKSKDFIIWQRNTQRGVKCMKALGYIDHSVNDIVNCFNDDRYRIYYDPGFDFASLLESIVPEQTKIRYLRTKKVAVVSARDIVFINHRERYPDGSVTIINYSIDRDDLQPTVKNAIRVWLHLSGWKFEYVSPQRTKVTYILDIELRGNLPGFIMTPFYKDIGRQVISLGETVPRYLKENPSQD
ncbi:UNKNOWN [Stylonychia lemnae]|uniref:START domain-containing protein n=1 Tax=Stylonychia lemnae TaxID=5949 RepID=A0A078AX36_STYLE|nr:UNKNOWN [Stylonychia lemnae]|eukprot:CDW87005.1 UNKNOWN [Stylonychia lemnae]